MMSAFMGFLLFDGILCLALAASSGMSSELVKVFSWAGGIQCALFVIIGMIVPPPVDNEKINPH